jgi:hypothetical protein
VASSAIPGHAYFNPLMSDVASPGHTPVPSVPGSRSPGPGSEIAAHHPGKVSISAPCGHDIFNPLVLPDASPGHTPLPGPGATSASRHAPAVGPRVTIGSVAGHDNFEPMNELGSSPGRTPMRHLHRPPGSRSDGAVFTEVCPMGILKQTGDIGCSSFLALH